MRPSCHRCLVLVGLLALGSAVARAGEVDWPEYLRQRTAACAARTAEWFQRVQTAPPDEWPRLREESRRQLQEMLGLWPLPERGELRATITGSIERAGVVAEKVHFQSSPGLYVTGTFYRPPQVAAPLPTILYLCGHARVVEDGVSLGNKTAYQHHGIWFARQGFCCLTIDTLQLGEIEGLHHGTYRENRWWWLARGYTPAGVEAWNALRALDYLETRPEVDQTRLGVTGRSGGGAYSWWLAALDDRPTCLVPVAGITDLANHVLDGCIEGHCDCMFPVNALGWDFGRVAALAAPRPLLLANTDRDRIFPLDGVLRIHRQLDGLYRHLGADDRLGLLVTSGPHEDTQDLQVPAFRWFTQWLRGLDEPVAQVAEKLFAPRELQVFTQLPADERNTRIDETFVPAADVGSPPTSREAWEELRQRWLAELRTRCFAGWPRAEPLDIKLAAAADGNGRRQLEFTSEPGLRLTVELRGTGDSDGAPPRVVQLLGDDEPGATGLAREPAPERAWARFRPRSAPAAPDQEAEARAHFLRRLALLGTTLDEGQVWDVRRAVAAIQASPGGEVPLVLSARGPLAGVALYASLFEPTVVGLQLEGLPTTHREGPIFLNILRVLDLPQALALALPRTMELSGVNPDDWRWTREVARLYSVEPSPLVLRDRATGILDSPRNPER